MNTYTFRFIGKKKPSSKEERWQIAAQGRSEASARRKVEKNYDISYLTSKVSVFVPD